MELKEFLELLKESKKVMKWEYVGLLIPRLRGVGHLEGSMWYFCPITAVYFMKTGKMTNTVQAVNCADELGLDLSLTAVIIDTADGSFRRSPEMAKQLREVLFDDPKQTHQEI